jgi:hypothetical protein
MSHNIEIKEFDSPFNKNKQDIHKVQQLIESTAPQGARIAWEYPGYISIVLSNGREIAFGNSLDDSTGYSWNSYEVDGTNKYGDSFQELDTVEEIVNKLWAQIAHLLSNEENK